MVVLRLHQRRGVIQVHEFSYAVLRGGVAYRAEAWGRRREDGLWEGSLLFWPDQGPPLRTARETTQTSLDTLTYWATGLEAIYLEGALERATPVRRRPAA
jgi:hypothetical protein